MIISTVVATRAAKFFDDMIASKTRIEEFANRFVSDIDNNVSPEASQLTMNEFKAFRKEVLGELDSLSVEDLKDLSHLTFGVNIDQAGSVVQHRYKNYRKIVSESESTLVNKYQLCLEDGPVFNFLEEKKNRLQISE